MLEIYYIYIASVLPDEDKWHGLRNWISEEAYRELSHIKNERVRFFRLVGESLVRYVLKDRWNIAPSSYQIVRQAKGKPYLKGESELFFNISHSGNYLVCAFSDREVGVDIEKRKEARMKVANRFFHPVEVENLMQEDQEGRDRLFYDLWAIKESFLKYIGTGLTRPLSSFRVSCEKGKINLYEGEKKLSLYVEACEIDSEYACYVCSESCFKPKVQSLLLEDLLKADPKKDIVMK